MGETGWQAACPLLSDFVCKIDGDSANELGFILKT
jgi:hypothetical protein